MGKRINWIDWAKTLGIFLVVFGHYYGPPENREIINFIYAFHLPFFFMLSGYLHKDSKDIKSYLIKNIRTLVIPYVLLNIIAACYLKFLSPFDFNKSLHYFLTGHPYAPGFACWFLYCLFFVKMFAYGLIKAPKWSQGLLMIGGISLVYFLPDIFNYRIDSAIVALPFFVVGYYIKQYNIMDYFNRKAIIVPTCILFFIIVCFGSLYNGFAEILAPKMWGNSVILFFIDAFIGSFMIFLFSKLLDPFEFKFVKVISSGTLLIMAFHNVNVVYALLYTFNLPGSPSNILDAFILAVLNITILYYPIIFIQKYVPFILGGRK